MKKQTIRTLMIAAASYLLLINLLVFFEKGNGGSIESIGDSIWYTLVTLTTVGYGDYFPITTGGKFIGGVFVVASLGLLLGLVSKVTEHFAMISERKKMGYYGTDFEHHIIVP